MRRRYSASQFRRCVFGKSDGLSSKERHRRWIPCLDLWVGKLWRERKGESENNWIKLLLILRTRPSGLLKTNKQKAAILTEPGNRVDCYANEASETSLAIFLAGPRGRTIVCGLAWTGRWRKTGSGESAEAWIQICKRVSIHRGSGVDFQQEP